METNGAPEHRIESDGSRFGENIARGKMPTRIAAGLPIVDILPAAENPL